MAIWETEIKDITPFDEEWLDPFNEGSLFDSEIYAQLYRGYNWLNREIGIDMVCDTTTRPNNYIFNVPGYPAFPTGDQVATVQESLLPLGQYINYTAKMLSELFTELNTFCTYSVFGDGTGAVISSLYGFSETDDRYWNIYDPDYDSTSSTFKLRLKEIIEEYDENLFNTLTTPILPASFNLKYNWGNIVKILQRGQELFTKKRSQAYTKTYGSITVNYINNSAEYPFENFSYIQKTGETIGPNYVTLDTADGYHFPGNNGHNFCPTQKTQYTNDDIYALPSWEEDIYANNLFYETRPNNDGIGAGFSGELWAVSGFDFQASDYHPLTPVPYFFSTYSYDSSSPCNSAVVYETGYGYTWYDRVYLKNVGWFKMGGSRRKYKLVVTIANLTSFSNDASIATFKVQPTWVVYPDAAGRSITVTGNEYDLYNSNQNNTQTMTITAQLTGAAYLDQSIVPLPTPEAPRNYGASIRNTGFKYFINGTELLNNFGYPRNTFFVYVSPCKKIYIDNSSLN